MKKFLALTAAVVALSGNAFAQAGGQATVSVPIQVTTVQNLDLGTITRDGTASGSTTRHVDVVQANNTADPGKQFAAFRIKSDAFDDVKVTAASCTLNWTSTSASQVSSSGASSQTTSIPATTFYFATYGAASNPASLRTQFGMNSPFTPEGNTGGMGQIDLAVGADFTIAPDLQRGSYNGTVNITVAYN